MLGLGTSVALFRAVHSGALPFTLCGLPQAGGDTLRRPSPFSSFAGAQPTPAPAGAARSAENLVGTTLSGRYRVEAMIGEGGMAVVYRARHTSIGQSVAVKVLRSGLSSEPKTVARFLREAQATSRIAHPHVVAITDFGVTHDKIVYAVMEHLQGEDLAATLRREGPLPWPRAQDIVSQICDAVQAAHDLGIVHRDIKPRNCFRVATREGGDYIKLLDFGIAKVVGDTAAPIDTLAGEGMIFGTPEYIAPEQAKSADNVDARADVYATGVLLYELLTGRAPFKSKNPMMTLAMHIYESALPPSHHVPGLPSAIDAVVMRALEKDPSQRFQSMIELKHALGRAARGLELPLEISGTWSAGVRPADATLIGRRRSNWLVSAATAAACVAGTLFFTAPAGEFVGDAGLEQPVAHETAPAPASTHANFISPARAEVAAPTDARVGTFASSPDALQADGSAWDQDVTLAQGVATQIENTTPGDEGLDVSDDHHEQLAQATTPEKKVTKHSRTRRLQATRVSDPWQLPPPPSDASGTALPVVEPAAPEPAAVPEVPAPSASSYVTPNPFAAP